MKDILELLARLCLSVLFLYEAYDTIAFFGATRAKMSEYNIVWQQDTLLYTACFFLVVGAIFLFIGYRAKFAAFLLLLYWLPLTFIVHSFWDDPIEIRRVQSILFMRNIAIVGALLHVIAYGSGKYSIKRLIDTRRIRNFKS